VERMIGSIRRECLDHVIVFHEGSLRRTLVSYFDYYPIADASLVGEGLAGTTTHSAAGNCFVVSLERLRPRSSAMKTSTASAMVITIG